MAPIVIESTPASTPLSDITRGFGDVIAALTARLAEKSLSPEHAHDLAGLAVTTVQGALILSRTLRTPEPFDRAIALLTASAQAVAATAQ